jgi:hypothetical protein
MVFERNGYNVQKSRLWCHSVKRVTIMASLTWLDALCRAVLERNGHGIRKKRL